MVAHELQHATQDVVLRKRHPDQMKMPNEDDSTEDYYASDIEFHPQVTTAVSDFKRMIQGMKREGRELSKKQLNQIFRYFVGASEQMPNGFLKYKPMFNSPFFRSLKRTDDQKWKKAVKEFSTALT